MTTGNRGYFIPEIYNSKYWQPQVFIIDHPEKEWHGGDGEFLCVMYDLIAGPREEDDQVGALHIIRKKGSDMGATFNNCKLKCSWSYGFYVRAGVINKELRRSDIVGNFGQMTYGPGYDKLTTMWYKHIGPDGNCSDGLV